MNGGSRTGSPALLSPEGYTITLSAGIFKAGKPAGAKIPRLSYVFINKHDGGLKSLLRR
jgi:hypothetical protein